MMATLLSVTSVLMSGGCTRRLLEDEYIPTAVVPVSINWSASGVPVEEMHRASVWLFPVNGEEPLQYHLEGNLNYREITVPVGVYSILVFNETIDDADWEGITFTGTNHYETFAAMSIPDAGRGLYTRSDTLPLVLTPEPLAVWSLDRFEVTPEMVNSTRSIANTRSGEQRAALENVAPGLTMIKPEPRIKQLTITAYITNLSSSMQVTGTIDGMAAGVYMVSGEKIPSTVTYPFLLNGRVYEDNGKDGTTTRTFNVFGKVSDRKAHQKMTLDILLADGTLYPRETFDATGLMVINPEPVIPTYMVNVGYDNANGDHLTVLPDMGTEGTISVGGWDEVIVPVK